MEDVKVQDGTTVQVEMPRYRSHKEVYALKIMDIRMPELQHGEVYDGRMIIKSSDDGYSSFTVDAAYVKKHQPKVGGYYVRYKDGYESWSPAEAFEEGYTRVN